MDFERRFNKPNYKLHYLETEAASTGFTLYHDEINTYRILCIFKGNANISFGNVSIKTNYPLILILKPHISLNVEFSNLSRFRMLDIKTHPSFFKNINDDGDFLRPFHKLNDNQCIFNLRKDENRSLMPLAESICNSLKVMYGQVHVEPRILSLFSELCLIFDNEYSDYILSTDSMAVKVADFIYRNYTGDISLKMIEDKFFISAPTINTIVKRWSGKTFWGFVTSLRLQDAVKMIKSSNLTLAKIAELCGFSDYSSFYRAYIKEFGISPSDDKKKYQKLYWPLST